MAITGASRKQAGLYYDKGGAVLNVAHPDYGAKLDGTTDDSGAVVAAVADANAITGGATVLIPPGPLLWGSDREAVITNGGVHIKMAGCYPGKIFASAAQRGSRIIIGANQSASLFRFTRDAALNNTAGCGIRAAFDGAARAYTVAGACVNVEYSDNFDHDCSYYAVKGRGLWTQRSVKGRFAIDLYQCGDTGLPALDVNKIDASNVTQGSTFTYIKAEVCYGDYYMNVASSCTNNKFHELGFETDSADALSQITYLNLAGANNQFGFLHMNKNAGAVPRIAISASKNQFSILKSDGTHGGDVLSFTAGQQNVFDNVRGELGTNATTIRLAALDSSSTYNVFNSVGLNGGNGIDGGTAVGTNVGSITHINKNSYSVQSLGANSRCGSIVDDKSISVASAATPVIPDGKDFVIITGTTNITTGITATHYPGRTITMQFAGILTVTDGSNLLLAGNFTTSANATLTVRSNGSNWFEIARSIN